MGRIDIVVFPNGGREIFGRMGAASPVSLASQVDAFVATLPSAGVPRKFTGYYDAPDASDIDWSVYDPNNPIVMVPMDSDEEDGVETYEPMELAQVPETQRAGLTLSF